jgi:hypothetical protein
MKLYPDSCPDNGTVQLIPRYPDKRAFCPDNENSLVRITGNPICPVNEESGCTCKESMNILFYFSIRSHNCCTRVFNLLLTYELQIREHISDMSLEVASYLFMCLRRMEQPLSNPIMQVSFFLDEIWTIGIITKFSVFKCVSEIV